MRLDLDDQQTVREAHESGRVPGAPHDRTVGVIESIKQFVGPARLDKAFPGIKYPGAGHADRFVSGTIDVHCNGRADQVEAPEVIGLRRRDRREQGHQQERE